MPPFSFTLHCVICFDPFDEEQHAPVILPCGHTFVCIECAQRLDNCHECRQSLFAKPPKTTVTAAAARGLQTSLSDDTDAMPSWYRPLPPKPSPGSRYAQSLRRKSVKSVSVVSEPIRLPLPKNLVLLEMVSAAKARMEELGDKADEEECFHMAAEDSIDAMTSECGVYIVKDSLEILKERPAEMDAGAKIRRTRSTKGLKDDASAAASKPKSVLTRKVWSAKKKGNKIFQSGTLPPKTSKKGSPTNRGSRKSDRSSSTPFSEARGVLSSDSSVIPPEIELLEHGDMVHVVSFKDGVAKLARRRGYILANSTQLVKVRGPQDDVCRIEGQLCGIMHKKRTYVQELEAMKKRRARLLRDLRLAMMDEQTQAAVEPAASKDLLKSLDEHFSVSGEHDEPRREDAPLSSRSRTPPSPQCVSEVYVDTSSKRSEQDIAPLPPPRTLDVVKRQEERQPEEVDDLGKTEARIAAVRKEYEASSCNFCGLFW